LIPFQSKTGTDFVMTVESLTITLIVGYNPDFSTLTCQASPVEHAGSDVACLDE
jgi:hypothetical protein